MPGVCSVGAGWGVTDFDELCNAAPDILVCNPEAMLDNLDQRGYLAEVICSNGARPEGHRGGILPCGSAPGPTALGRYMVLSDERNLTSALSANILELKKSDAPASLFGTAVAAFVQECGWTPDCVVPVPPKPSQGRQRSRVFLKRRDRCYRPTPWSYRTDCPVRARSHGLQTPGGHKSGPMRCMGHLRV